jgi:hypothetical protein
LLPRFTKDRKKNMSHAAPTEKPNISSSAALWSVLIFVGLIIAAINFVQAESKSEGHGGHGAANEQHGGAAHHGESHEAAGGHEAEQAEHGAEHAAAPAALDTSKHEGHESHEAPAAAGHAKEEAHH